MSNIAESLQSDIDAHYVNRLEDAVVSAICIIQNEACAAGILGNSGKERRLLKWCEELKGESGVDFQRVLARLET